MVAISPDVLVGDRRFRCYGTAKLTRAVDLALDKISGSKYSFRLGESPRGGAKSPTNGSVEPWGWCCWGVKKAGLLYGCLRDALGECGQRRFF